MKLLCLIAVFLSLGCTAPANAQGTHAPGIPQFSTHSQLSHYQQNNQIQDQSPTFVVPTDMQLNGKHSAGELNPSCELELQSLARQLEPLLGASWDVFLSDEETRFGNDCSKRVAWRTQALDKMRPHK